MLPQSQNSISPKLLTGLMTTVLFTSHSFAAIAATQNATPMTAMTPEAACKSLADLNLEAVGDKPAVIQSVTYDADAKRLMDKKSMFGKRSIVQGGYLPETTESLPSYCLVEGYVAPAIKFVLALPDMENWNDKIFYGACNAFCGGIEIDELAMPVSRGYASITTDGGHINKRPFDGVWGYNNPEAEIDFSHRASHMAAQISKHLANEYYGKPAKHAYIVGFSKGGHAGIKSALTYPDDFDGILSRAPTVNYQEINVLRMPYIVKSNQRADGSFILQSSDVKFLHNAVKAYCDPRDGLADGMIEDPRQCDFDPSTLLCDSETESDTCLSAEKVAVIEKFYSNPTNDDGVEVYPYPMELGSEPNWLGFHVPRAPGAEPFAASIARTYIRYIAFKKDPGANYDWKSFDGHKDRRKLRKLEDMINANDPDLKAFNKTGGKMIVMHGWADGAVSARSTIDWYENVKAEMGDDVVPEFARLFLMSGNTHGATSAGGPNVSNALDLLENWVENGVAPKVMTMKNEEVAGEKDWTRPVYPYPLVAKYKGTGDIYNADSFAPAMPDTK